MRCIGVHMACVTSGGSPAKLIIIAGFDDDEDDDDDEKQGGERWTYDEGDGLGFIR